MTERAPTVRQAAAAGAFFFTVVLLVALPALVAAPHAYIGEPYSDLWKHLWGHGWAASELRKNFALPVETPCLKFPTGGTLFVIDSFNCVVVALLDPWVTEPRLFNLLVLSQLALGAWGAWRLAFHVTEDACASAVAGCVYGLSPLVLSYSVGSGVSETLGLMWVPLSAVYVLRAIGNQGRADALKAAACLVGAGFNSWYYLVFALQFNLLLVLASLVWGQKGTWLPARAPGLLVRGLVAVLLAGLALSPLMVPFVVSFDRNTSLEAPIESRPADASTVYAQLERYFPLVGFVRPGKLSLEFNDVFERLQVTPYVGFVTLLLAFAGIVRGGGMRTWALLALWFFLLTLGPYICLTREIHTSSRVNFAYLVTAPLLGVSMLSAPFRYHILTMLCLGILAAAATARLWPRRPLVAGLACVLIVAEVCLVSPTPFPLPTSDARHEAVTAGLDLTPDVGVLDVPPQIGETELTPGRYFYDQLQHGGGIPYTTAGSFAPSVGENEFFRQMWLLSCGLSPSRLDPVAAGQGLSDCAVLGFRYVVLHREYMRAAQARYAERVLRCWLGPPVRVEGSCVLFVLDSVSARSAR